MATILIGAHSCKVEADPAATSFMIDLFRTTPPDNDERATAYPTRAQGLELAEAIKTAAESLPEP